MQAVLSVWLCVFVFTNVPPNSAAFSWLESAGLSSYLYVNTAPRSYVPATHPGAPQSAAVLIGGDPGRHRPRPESLSWAARPPWSAWSANWSREDPSPGLAGRETARRDRETFGRHQITNAGEVLWRSSARASAPASPSTRSTHFGTRPPSPWDDTFSNIGLDAPVAGRGSHRQRAATPTRPAGGRLFHHQQLVRHVAFDCEGAPRSYERKDQEIVLAWMMNRVSARTKSWGYLNVYYGNLAYGVEATSPYLCGKSVSGVDAGQASLLAGLPQSPVDLGPFTNLGGAKTASGSSSA